MPDPFTTFGLLVSLFAFLRSEIGGRTSKDELLKALEDQNVIQKYLEWLRRKDQGDLLNELQQVKGQLVHQHEDIMPMLSILAGQIQTTSHELGQRIEELNQQITVPDLFPTPLETRAALPITLQGRDAEVKSLTEATTDTLVSGQPGSGKTFLLQEVARISNGHFLLTSDPDKATQAVLAFKPAVIIIDDALDRQVVIQRLRHLRTVSRLQFRIIAVCWPFEKEALLQTMQLSARDTVVLEGLPRPDIGKIIAEVVKLRNIQVNDAFIHFVAKQAQGRPGLAVSLSLATLAASGEDLVSGELLRRDIEPFLVNHIGTDALVLLACFACGGKEGLTVEAVANATRKPITEVMASAKKIALAGVFEETRQGTLVVCPGFLRSALIKQIFFPQEGVGLGLSFFETVVSSMTNRVEAYHELVLAKARAHAKIDDSTLHDAAIAYSNDKLYNSIAHLNESNCRWVLSVSQALSTDVKQAALRYVPSEIIPTLLVEATQDNRPLNAHPDADLRLLKDWICCAEGTEAITKRQLLINGAINWMEAGGNKAIAYKAIRTAFSLHFENTGVDPMNPTVFHFTRSLISLENAKRLFAYWPKILESIQTGNDVPWPGTLSLIEEWRQSEGFINGKLSDEYVRFIEDSVRCMVSDLIPLSQNNEAARRWLYLVGQKVKAEVQDAAPSLEFMTLFPEENFDEDWTKNEKAQREAVARLAEQLVEVPFIELVDKLQNWETQVNELGNEWQFKLPHFFEDLAAIRTFSANELDIAIQRLSDPCLKPILSQAFANQQITDHHLELCFNRPDLKYFLIQLGLSGNYPQIYERLQPDFAAHKDWIGVLCLRNQVPQEMLQTLLRRNEVPLRLAIALQMFRADHGKTISAGLKPAWKLAILDGLSSDEISGYGETPHDFKAILSFEPSLRGELLEKLVAKQNVFIGYSRKEMWPTLVSGLSVSERSALLEKCKHLPQSRLPELLVGRSPELYAELLDISELKEVQLSVLSGDPNDAAWLDQAKLALKAGHSAAQVSAAVQGHGYSWTGGLSGYYQQWIDRFGKLMAHSDLDAKAIAAEGIKWSTEAREHELKREKREAIYGLDSSLE